MVETSLSWLRRGARGGNAPGLLDTSRRAEVWSPQPASRPYVPAWAGFQQEPETGKHGWTALSASSRKSHTRVISLVGSARREEQGIPLAGAATRLHARSGRKPLPRLPGQERRASERASLPPRALAAGVGGGASESNAAR